MKKFSIDVDPETDEYVLTMRFKCNKRRLNPNAEYELDMDIGSYSEIIGVVNQATDEFGFAYTIDMDYKGKEDQYTDRFLDVSVTDVAMESTDFINLCEEWSIPYVIE